MSRVRLKLPFFILFLLYFEVDGRGGEGNGFGFLGIGSSWPSDSQPHQTLNESRFRGNISSDDIYNALFSSRHRIFSSFSAHVFGAREKDLSKIAEPKTVLTVRNAKSPFIIGNSSMVFFWERPSESDDCVNYILSNQEDMRVGFCKTQLESCSRPIRDIQRLASYEFSSPFTDFTWFCPRGALCCEWECCDAGEPSTWSRLLDSLMYVLRKTLVVIDIILIIIVGLPLAAVGCYFSLKCINWTLKWGEKFSAEDYDSE